MLHVLTLFSVSPEAADPFVDAIRRGGEWHSIARSLMPDLIATNLLEQQPSATPPLLSGSSLLFVCLDFWSSPDAYRRACQQPACQALFCARRRMAKNAVELGAFCFPEPIDIDSVVRPAVALA